MIGKTPQYIIQISMLLTIRITGTFTTCLIAQRNIRLYIRNLAPYKCHSMALLYMCAMN